MKSHSQRIEAPDDMAAHTDVANYVELVDAWRRAQSDMVWEDCPRPELYGRYAKALAESHDKLVGIELPYLNAAFAGAGQEEIAKRRDAWAEVTDVQMITHPIDAINLRAPTDVANFAALRQKVVTAAASAAFPAI